MYSDKVLVHIPMNTVDVVLWDENITLISVTDIIVRMECNINNCIWLVDGIEMKNNYRIFIGNSGEWNGLYRIITLPDYSDPYATLEVITSSESKFDFNVRLGSKFKGSLWYYQDTQYIRVITSFQSEHTKSNLDLCTVELVKEMFDSIVLPDFNDIITLSDLKILFNKYKQINLQKQELKEIIICNTTSLKETTRLLSTIQHEIDYVTKINENQLVCSLYDFVHEVDNINKTVVNINNSTKKNPQDDIHELVKCTGDIMKKTNDYLCSIFNDQASYLHNYPSKSYTYEFCIPIDLNNFLKGIDVLSESATVSYFQKILSLKCEWGNLLTCTNIPFYEDLKKSLFELWFKKTESDIYIGDNTNLPSTIDDSKLLYWVQYGDFSTNCFTLCDITGILDQIRYCKKYDIYKYNTLLMEKKEAIGCELQLKLDKLDICIVIYLKQI